MSKRGRSRNWKDQALVLWYRWEFMRRNPKYVADFEECQRLTQEWSLRNVDLHQQIYAKKNSDCNFSKTRGILITSDSHDTLLPSPFSNGGDGWWLWDIEFEPSAESEEEWDRRFMSDTVEICDAENESPTTLGLEDLDEPRKSRGRFADFDLQLKAWDLRNEGLSVREIAKLMYPSDFEACKGMASSDNLLFRRVRDHISRAQRRIDGGYREIV
jgi:hypothetical protein